MEDQSTNQEVTPTYFAKSEFAQPVVVPPVENANIGPVVAMGTPQQLHPQPEQSAKADYPLSPVYSAPAYTVHYVKPPADYLFYLLAAGGVFFWCLPLIPLYTSWKFRSTALSAVNRGDHGGIDSKNSYKWMKISLYVAAAMVIIGRGIMAILYATDTVRAYMPEEDDDYAGVRSNAIITQVVLLFFFLFCIGACFFVVQSQETKSSEKPLE